MKSFNTSLERHIFHLLFQEDRVDIPGLGRFDAAKYGSKIQLESGLFLPPARRLSFSPVAGKSETLVNHLMRFESLDNHAVDVMLGYQVQQWQQALSEGKRLRLDGLGTLAKTGLQWVFQPAIEANFLPEAYGLPIFRATPLANLVVPIRTEEIPIKTHSWTAPLRAAAVVTGAVTLLALGASKADFRDMVQSASFDPATEWRAFRSTASDWIDDAFAKEASPREAAVDAPVVIERDIILSDVEMEPSKEGPRFFLIVGAFSEVTNAKRLEAKLLNDGYPATWIKPAVGLNKVAIRTFASRQEANKAKAALKPSFPAVWIYSE